MSSCLAQDISNMYCQMVKTWRCLSWLYLRPLRVSWGGSAGTRLQQLASASRRPSLTMAIRQRATQDFGSFSRSICSPWLWGPGCSTKSLFTDVCLSFRMTTNVRSLCSSACASCWQWHCTRIIACGQYTTHYGWLVTT
jgi:hypothetical protein